MKDAMLTGFVLGNLVGGSALLVLGIVLALTPFIVLGAVGFLVAMGIIYYA